MYRPHIPKALRARSTLAKVFILFSCIALAFLVVSQILANSAPAQAGPGGRAVFDVAGDKDDLPNLPSNPISCSRATTGHGIVTGTITDVNTGQPIANAYVGISPGTVNSFACYTTTDANGVYSFYKLNPGTYNLTSSRWTVNGTAPLYRDSVVSQIPIGSGKATINVALTPLQSPGYRIIGSNNATNLILVDMDETYYNAWFTDYNSVANPSVTPNVHNIANAGVNAVEEWTQYGYSPIDHYQLAVGGYPSWRTPDAPAAYWTQPNPNLDVNLWYSGGSTKAEEFGQESIFDVAKSYGMSTAVIGGNDYPSGHITDANIDEISLDGTNPCSAPNNEIYKMENFIKSSISNPNGFLLYAPLTQAEGFNTENTSPDAPPQVISCSSANGWTYAQASIWDDQSFGKLLHFLKTTKEGSSTLFQNTAIIITSDEAENDLTNFDNFYPTGPGEPGLGTTRHTPFVVEGPNINSGLTYKKQMRIDDVSVNLMAELGLPAPFDSRGQLIPQFFVTPPTDTLPPVPPKSTPSQGYVSLLENDVGGYTTTISAQNESSSPVASGSIVVYNKSGNVVAQKKLKAPLMPNSDWVINAGSLGLAKGFSGTALLQADEPLAVVTNETSSGAPVQSLEGYSAQETGSALHAPLIVNNVNGATSQLAITNLSPCSSCATTVTASFYSTQGKLLGSANASVAPFGQYKLNVGSVGLPANSYASAVITSSPQEPLAATVYAQASGVRTFTYNALSSGDTSLTGALVENSVNGQSTSLTVQNTAKSPTTATVTYLNPDGSTALALSISLKGQGSVTQAAAAIGLPTGFSGSVSISAAGKVVAVSQVFSGSSASAYDLTRGLDYTLYTPVFVPQVQNSVNGATSAVTVTNTGTLSTTDQIAYYNLNGEQVGNTPTVSLAPGASAAFNQGDPSSGLQTGFIGSAVITSSNFQHSAVVVSSTGASSPLSYDGSQAQTGQLVLTIGQLRQGYKSFNGLLVTVINATVTRVFGSNWFIQDNTGGIRIYVGGGANAQGGDIETVTGVLTNYAGEIEIDPAGASDVVKTGTGPIPTPVTITTQQIAQMKYTDTIDGELVTVPQSTITYYNPPTLGLTDSSNVQGTAYFDYYAQQNINLSNFSQGEQVVTTGVMQMYGNNVGSGSGEINPLLTSDFVPFTERS
jgi:hypothetical protein